MARIADHCQPGGWRGNYEPHALVCAWPDSVYVQWGGHGLVIDRKANTSRNTAFFEAFPDGGGFIRGEGATVEDAERAAFTRYEREQACGHVWGRRGYRNGGGVCVKCAAFQGSRFPEISPLGYWRKPLNRIENDLLRLADGRSDRDPNRAKYYRMLRLRKKVFGADEDPATLRDHVGMLFGGSE